MTVPSPKIHVLGSGCIAALLGTALHSTVPPSYVTFLMRNKDRVTDLKKHDNRIKLRTDATGRGQVVETKIQGIHPYEVMRSGDPHPIDNLIVTTKAPDVYNALKQVQPALHPKSNVLILHNGLGVYDTVVKRLWPSAAERPQFSIGVTTHSVYRDGSVPWLFNHVFRGHLSISEVPKRDEDHFNLHMSSDQATAAEESVKSDYMDDVLRRSSEPTTRDTTSPTSSEECVKADYDKLEVTPPGSKPNVQDTAIPTDSEEAAKSDYNDPLKEQARERRKVKQNNSELIRALQAARGVLDVQVLPYPELLLAQYEKLVCNAVINPLTAIYNCPNGDLAGLHGFDKLATALVKEATSILLHHSRVVYSPDTWFIISAALEPSRMLNLVYELIEQSNANVSSMLYDVRRGKDTEIDFLNGYLVRLAKEYGLSAANNMMMCNMVHAKVSQSRAEANEFIPLV